MYELAYRHTLGFVIFATATAVVAAYMTIHFLDHIARSPSRKFAWRTGGALILGTGIWLLDAIGYAAHVYHPFAAGTAGNAIHIHPHWSVMLWALLLAIGGAFPPVLWLSGPSVRTVRLLAATLWLDGLLFLMQQITLLSMDSPTVHLLMTNRESALHAYLFSLAMMYAAFWLVALRRSHLPAGHEWWKVGAALLFGGAMAEAHFGLTISAAITASAATIHHFPEKTSSEVWTLRLEVLSGILALGILALISGSAEQRFAAHAGELRQREQRYRSLFDHNPDAVFELDLHGRFLTGNIACEAIFGQSRADLIGHSLAEFIPQDERQNEEQALIRVALGRPQAYESVIRKSNGEDDTFVHITHIPIIVDNRVTGVYTVIKNISERKNAAVALQRSESVLTAAHHTAQLGTWSRTFNEQEVMHCSPETQRIFGLKSEAELGTFDKLLAYVHPDDRPLLLESLAESQQNGSAYSLEYRIIRPDGNERYVRTNGVLIRGESGEANEIVGTIQDITDMLQLQVKAQRLSEIVEASQSLIATSDVVGRLIYLNTAGRQLLDVPLEEDVTHSTVSAFMTQESLIRASDILPIASSRGTWHGEAELRSRSGAVIPVAGAVQAHRAQDGTVRYFSYIARDVTEERQLASQLQFQAYHDNLTHLPNRAMFDNLLESALAEAAANGWMTAVMFIDLDEFKRINDSLGHPVGDAILREIAGRLYRRSSAAEVIARWGGDEFTVLLPRVASAAAAEERAHAFLDAIFAPVHVAQHNFYITASLGYCLYPDDGADAALLVKCADTAMYAAKEQGKNRAARYAISMSEHAVKQLVLEGDMRGAIKRGELQVFFQPQINVENGVMDSVEALLRWRHPTMGFVPPEEFIPLMEQTGLIVSVGEWAMRQACRQAERWRRMYAASPRVAVNVSAQQINQPDFVELVRQILDTTGLPADLLELEITEGTVMKNEDHVIGALRALRAMGVHISLDDFGVGYSSLTYLTRYPVDTLKIDQSFVRDATERQDHAAVIEATILLAHSLHLKVVAEGVENEAQFAFLKARGCDRIQGFLLSPPAPPEELSALLEAACADDRVD